MSYCIYRTRQDTQVFIYIESSFRKKKYFYTKTMKRSWFMSKKNLKNGIRWTTLRL